MNIETRFKLLIDPAVISRFPLYGCVVVYARNIENGAAVRSTIDRLKQAEQEVKNRSLGLPPNHPHLSAWRLAYQAFGAKPKKHLSAVDALTTRVLEGGVLPDINPVVNAYNRVSLLHVIPVGGEDWDQLRSDLVLRVAVGNEPFVTRRSGETVVEHPDKGEVIWADSESCTCRRWNWRQCQRTAIGPTTTSAYFVFDVLPPFGIAEATRAAEDLVGELLSFCPRLSVETEVLRTPGIAG